MSLLPVRRLDVFFDTPDGRLVGAQDIAFSVEPGRTTALVGESGSGKTVSAMSILQLLPYPVAAHSERSQVLWKGEDLLQAQPKALRGIRGNEISMIFQEPQISLNPVQKVDRQVAEIIMIHQRIDMRKAREMVPGLLEDVGLRDPKRQARSYPHELSGGQRQRDARAKALSPMLRRGLSRGLGTRRFGARGKGVARQRVRRGTASPSGVRRSRHAHE